MPKRSGPDDVPDELREALLQTHFIIDEYLRAIGFIIHDTGRDPKYKDTNLLFYLSQDFLQSAVALTLLATEGLLVVAKREIRFILETSIKLCFVQQQDYAMPMEEKLVYFEDVLKSQKISINKNITLGMLPEDARGSFNEEVGRLYGLTSSYVHLTPAQIKERINAVDSGKTAGKESAEDILALNEIITRGLSASIVLLYHAVPPYVAGDWLVEENGSTVRWYFSGSRFIAMIDEYFDYKHERQHDLAGVKDKRRESISF